VNYGKSNTDFQERGAALLLTLLMLSLLVVLVGQFSYTVALDRKVAINYVHDAQVSLDIAAGVNMAAAQFVQPGNGGPQGGESNATEMELELGESLVLISSEEENAKFNVNIILNPPEGVSQSEAEAALERLLKVIDEPEGTLPAGLAANISQYLRDKGSPALTLKELVNVPGMTEELLYSHGESQEAGLDGGFGGLSRYITVWSDGLINYNTAGEEILLSLVEGMNGQLLDAVLQALGNPSQKVPRHIEMIADRFDRFVKPDSSTFSVTVQSQSGNYTRKCMAVLHLGETGISVLLWDELEP
jgi:hypothetical protein